MATTQSRRPRAKNQAKSQQAAKFTIRAVPAANVDKVWTTVGSAGTLDEASVGKVFFDHSVVQMGRPVSGPHSAAKGAAIPPLTQSAVIRYNVTPVDGLFTLKAAPCIVDPGGSCAFYALTVRCLAAGSNAKVVANLIEVDLATGAETVRLTFQSSPTSNSYKVQFGESNLGPNFSFDFVSKAYYIEATLTASSIAAGSAAGIQIIKIGTGVVIF
jgi:hypothetical protein